ncbi:MAG: exonuclease domain-containing protein [Bacilli bacterium]|nr:exonuclease domain-containing protein [Bacilli bacterium]
MKALEKIFKDKTVLVFSDLEGTQFSHEMIEIGAHLVILNKDYTVKKIMKGYSSYVKAKNRIGHVVTELTGITEQLLKEKGRPFPEVFKQFRGYVGKYWNKCKFVTFGTHDLRMINMSVENSHKDDELSELAHYVKKKNFDISAIVGQYIQDQNGNPLSLSNNLKVFKQEFEGTKHSAAADAYNTALLYKAFIENPEIVQEEYKKALTHVHHMPRPINMVISKLFAGESITPEDFDEAIKESLK